MNARPHSQSAKTADLVPTVPTNAFPLRLKYPEEGYHRSLVTNLENGEPLLKWSKKVVQWSSKLNGFCYLKHFTHQSRATITNILGPFPTGQQLYHFWAFEHSNCQDLLTDTIGTHTYHYWWAHKRTLGPPHTGRIDRQGHYGRSTYTLAQIELARHLGLGGTPWGFDSESVPSSNPSPYSPLTKDPNDTCQGCGTPRHRIRKCPYTICKICEGKGHFS